MTDSALPHDAVAERAVLAAMFLRPACIPATAESLPHSAFYSLRHRAIYKALIAVQVVHGDKTDLVLVRNHLETTGKLEEAGGFPYVVDLLDGIARSESVEGYAQVVLECSQRREAVSAGALIQDIAIQPGGAVHAARYAGKWAELIEKNGRLEEPNRISVQDAIRSPLEPIPWLVEDWLANEESTQFGGEWSMGKSYVALDLAISLAANLPWMGKVRVDRACPVVYVDEENPGHVARRRIKRMVEGRNLSDEAIDSLPLTYLHRNGLCLSRTQGVATLRREIERTGAKVVVLDSLIRLLGVDENDNTAIAKFYAESVTKVSAAHGCAFVILDHMRKPGKDDGEIDPGHRIRGGSDKPSVVDEVWTLTGDRQTDTRTLAASKARAGGKLAGTLTLRYCESEDESTCWIEAVDADMQGDAGVIGVLSSAGPQGMRSSELVAALGRLGVSRSTALRSIRRALSRGDISKRIEGSKGVRYWAGLFAP